MKCLNLEVSVRVDNYVSKTWSKEKVPANLKLRDLERMLFRDVSILAPYVGAELDSDSGFWNSVSRDDGLWIVGAHHVTDPLCPVSYFTQKTFYGDVAAIHFIQQRYDPALEEFRKENSFDDSPLSSPRGYDGDICTAPTTPPK